MGISQLNHSIRSFLSTPVLVSAVEDVRSKVPTPMLASIHSQIAHQGSRSRQTLPTTSLRTAGDVMSIMQAVRRRYQFRKQLLKGFKNVHSRMTM